MRTFMVFVAMAACNGCVMVRYNGADTKSSQVDYPEIGKVVTVSVGDELLAKGTITEEKVLVVKRTIDGGCYDIPAGSYKQLGSDSRNDFYSAAGVIKNAFCDHFQALSLGKAEGAELCVVTVLSTTSCYPGDYERTTRMSERGKSFQQTLIYNGRVGNKINVGYREFSSNLARPAFNNDVEYDLSASRTIGYKGAQLEVIDANNSSITYKVLKNFP